MNLAAAGTRRGLDDEGEGGTTSECGAMEGGREAGCTRAAQGQHRLGRSAATGLVWQKKKKKTDKK